MKVSRTVYPEGREPFNELQAFYRNVRNRIYGITNNQPVRSQFPIGDHRSNKFKTNQNV